MSNPKTKAQIVIIGAGWWSQNWHLPQLHRNNDVTIAAIVDKSDNPKSNLDPSLKPLAVLSDKYSCPIFHSVEDLLSDPVLGPVIDGVIVCTPHSTHCKIGRLLLQEGQRRQAEGGPPMNILMEKPMTTNVRDAKALHDLAAQYTSGNSGKGHFLVNHSANYRIQAQKARELVQSGQIGSVRHVTAFFASPLMWIFDDPSMKSWNEPDSSDPDMIGNGFAWGQSSHILAWVYHVCADDLATGGCRPKRVFCSMTHSEKTGADLSHAATVECEGGVTFSVSGTSLLPGNAHSDPPVGKQINILIFGSKGCISYCGNDRDSDSGCLELRKSEGTAEALCSDVGFEFEDLEQEGLGPASMKSFINACLDRGESYVGASSEIGLRTVQTIDAMYRSHKTGKAEDVL